LCSSDVDKILAGIGNKVALFLQMFSAFIAGFAIAFVYGWKLALVILAVSPILAISGAIMAKVRTRLS
jgi:ABC-type multidrug transport system fused ATPase/permease subunit